MDAQPQDAAVEQVRAELRAAVHAVSASYAELATAAQEGLNVGLDPLEAEVDAALLAGEAERGSAAVRAWREHWTAEVRRAAGGEG